MKITEVFLGKSWGHSQVTLPICFLWRYRVDKQVGAQRNRVLASAWLDGDRLRDSVLLSWTRRTWRKRHELHLFL